MTLPTELSERDIWVPTVLFAHNGTMWKTDNHHNVTWDVTHKPTEVSNPVGIIFLRRDGIINRKSHFSLNRILH